MSEWHVIDAQEASINSTAISKGLLAAEADRRLVEYGPNELVEWIEPPWILKVQLNHKRNFARKLVFLFTELALHYLEFGTSIL
jgi:hypothetical protein